MGAILFAVAMITLCIGLCVAFAWAVENDLPAIGIPTLILAAIFAIAGLIGGINAVGYIHTVSTLDTQVAYKIEQREMYVDALTAYQDLRIQDVTSSESYLSLYKEILSFNHECNKANTYNNIWYAKGLLYNPSYVGIDPVPLRMME